MNLQLSVDKTGLARFNAPGIDEIGHLDSIKVKTVQELQEKFPHTIWLVGQYIHVNRTDGRKMVTNWGNTERIDNFCAMNVENLITLATFLEGKLATKFNMAVYCDDGMGENVPPLAHECGTIACAVGHGPSAGIPAIEDDWDAYSERVFGLKYGTPEWRWCFDHMWFYVDNTATGAAKRIRHLVDYGVPNNWGLQLNGKEPYMFKPYQSHHKKKVPE